MDLSGCHATYPISRPMLPRCFEKDTDMIYQTTNQISAIGWSRDLYSALSSNLSDSTLRACPTPHWDFCRE